MRVTPLKDGSLWIEEPEKTSGFDMGNRALFIKTNGSGDLNQIFFVQGALAGSWQLNLTADGIHVHFQTARAIGRLWQLHYQNESAQISVTLFLDEKTPSAFERIEVSAGNNKSVNLEVSVKVYITAPPAPKGNFKDLVATFLPRIPAYSGYWGWGMGRWLRTPSPRHLRQTGEASLEASGRVAWKLDSSQPFTKCSIKNKTAKLNYSLQISAGQSKCLDLALGDANSLSKAGLLEQIPAALQNANDYAEWLAGQIDIEDPLLHSLYVAGLNASVSMFKEFPAGVKGLMAGPDYAFPPRIYFRDSYWTAQALMCPAPQLVRAHLLSLAAGVHADGQCPSGIFVKHLLQFWHAPANCNADWLPNHFDSPAFFILLLNDYLQATGDWELLTAVPQAINPRLGGPELTVGQFAHAAMDYLISQDCDGDGLIEKPYAANDWADNVRRSTWVAYDQSLYIAALKAYTGLCQHIEAGGSPKYYQGIAGMALEAMQRELWDDELGYLVNYRRPGFTEKNLSVDTLVALYFHLLNEPHTRSVIRAADFSLRANNNHSQPYGNYGLLCVFPPYSKAADLFDKSAHPYCYHNGADWPYWDGMVASILLERRDPAGLAVLSRWWVYGLKQGWLTPVEYYSPPYPVGGMLQGWSSMPAATLFRQLPVVKELLDEKTAK
jgi:hypothetical protein